MQLQSLIVLILGIVIGVLAVACAVLLGVLLHRAAKRTPRKSSLRAWWQTHKPTRRRIIQVYTALLFNANIKGFVTGRISTSASKYFCVPGMNCYSCPGAIGACPLGALQNAFAQSSTRTPVFMLGIILLYGIIFARTVCGFLCPVGLGQELLYKIKTPKIKKSKVTYVLSYFKYVLLAVLVVAVPLIYSHRQIAIPGFCKYICPAGTLGGAVGLLLNPLNADLYGMLGRLFTWKFIVLVLVMAACVFLYRFFCRFLCPLGAIYGFFNKIAFLGVKLDSGKCTDCGLCVDHCKMDIRKVGDHECINCGECIDVCPAKAISWKGSKLFLRGNAVGAAEEPKTAARPLVMRAETVVMTENEAPMSEADGTVAEGEAVVHETNAPAAGRRSGRKFPLRAACGCMALAVLAGVLLYYNVFADRTSAEAASVVYTMEADSATGEAGVYTFTIRESGKEPRLVVPQSGVGTAEDPFLLTSLGGIYEINIAAGADGTEPVYFRYTVTRETKYTLEEITAGLGLKITYTGASGGREVAFDLSTFSTDKPAFTLSPKPAGGALLHGNRVGDLCYDFTLNEYTTGETFTLSAYRGKIVIINFWATWCGPCVSELPEFQRMTERYDQVEVVAVHSAMITEPVQAFLDSKADALQPGRVWRDWNIHFVQDTGNAYKSEIYDLLGGKGSYPVTLIVDAEGYVRLVRQGPASAELLQTEIEKLL